MMPPPNVVWRHAVMAGQLSMCAKSKRGAVVYHPETLAIVGMGFNGQPLPFECTGSDECRKACAKLCLHAEQLAIEDALASTPGQFVMSELAVVHAKVVDGKLVGGGGPSCWQCSRLVMHHGMRGVWLYELIKITEENAGVVFPEDKKAEWKFYDAQAFHVETLKACGLPAQLAELPTVNR